MRKVTVPCSLLLRGLRQFSDTEVDRAAMPLATLNTGAIKVPGNVFMPSILRARGVPKSETWS